MCTLYIAIKLQFIVNCHTQKGYREGKPLLTVETEANGDLWSTNEGGPSLVRLLGSSCQYKRFFILPWLLWSPPVQHFFSSIVHYFNLCVPHLPATPGQSVVQGRLTLKWVCPVLLIICTGGPHRRPYSVYFSKCKYLFVLLSQLSCMLVKDVRGCATNSGSPEVLSMAHFV